jgi:hypothetical protein
MVKIGFAPDLQTLYVYLKRIGVAKPRRARLWIQDREFAASALVGPEVSTKALLAEWGISEKLWNSQADLIGRSPHELRWAVAGNATPDCLWTRLDRSFVEGKPVFIRAAIAEDREYVAADTVRVLARFPITVDNGMVVQDLVAWSGEGTTGPHLRQVLICPSHRHGTFRQAATKIMEQGAELRHHDPLAFQLTHVCKAVQTDAAAVFAPLNDMIITNVATGAEEPAKRFGGLWEHPSQRLAGRISTAVAPRPWIALVDLAKDERLPLFRHRPPSPDEVRMMVYYAISRGAGGIHWRHVPDPHDDPLLFSAMRAVSTELETIGPLLCMGCPANLGSTNDERVEAATILCGPDAILLLLINHDWDVPKLVDEYLPTHYHPRKNVRVELDLPFGRTLQRVEPIGDASPIEDLTEDKGSTSFVAQEVHTCSVYRVLLRRTDIPHESTGRPAQE